MGSCQQTSAGEGAMKQLCPVLILVLLTAELSNSQIPCCGVKIVAGQGDLDDRYELVREGSEKPEDICADGCIYKRESIPVDEYCFLNKETTGSVVCQASQTTFSGENLGTTPSIDQASKKAFSGETLGPTASLDQASQTTFSAETLGTTASLEDLELQLTQIKEEERIAEEELEADLEEEATLSDAEAKVNGTEAFIDRLTSDSTQPPEGRKQRQAATSCAEIAGLIDDMKKAVEQGDIVGMVTAAVRIMTSGITGCSAAEREIVIKKKAKIQDCRGRVRERIVIIKIKIKTKREKIRKIKEKKEKIVLAISKRPTRRPPVKPKPIENTPIAFGSNPISKPFEESSPIAFGSKPDKPGKTNPIESVTKPSMNNQKESSPVGFGSKPNKPNKTKPIESVTNPSTNDQKESSPVAFESKPNKPGKTKPIDSVTKPSTNNQKESSPVAFESKPNKPGKTKPIDSVTKPSTNNQKESSPVA